MVKVSQTADQVIVEYQYVEEGRVKNMSGDQVLMYIQYNNILMYNTIYSCTIYTIQYTGTHDVQYVLYTVNVVIVM